MASNNFWQAIHDATGYALGATEQKELEIKLRNIALVDAGEVKNIEAECIVRLSAALTALADDCGWGMPDETTDMFADHLRQQGLLVRLAAPGQPQGDAGEQS